jgi:Cof subfamily protein (haloacid dehalogenase superfamily)
MRYRLVVVDVDGTLLDSRHQLRPRVTAAVRAVCEAGLVVTLATGKLLPSVRPLLTTLGVHGPQITLNGAATIESETGETLRFCPLSEPARQEIISAVGEVDPEILLTHFSIDSIYVDRVHPLLGVFDEYGEGPPILVPDLRSPALPPAAKILLSGPPARLSAIREVLTPRFSGRVTITTTTPDFLEFFALDAGKGLALAALGSELGLARSEIVAIGDGENDAPLLREAGLAVAMANGAQATREAASYITSSNDEDGVALVLERLLTGEALL